jgi:hypothetical protein
MTDDEAALFKLIERLIEKLIEKLVQHLRTLDGWSVMEEINWHC